MSEAQLRKMMQSDLPRVMALLAKWNMAPRLATADSPDPERSGVDVENGFVAILDDRLVGTCSYIVHSDTLAETASLAVDPDIRGAGIGYRLQVARLLEMRRRGIQKVRTETDRPETIRWYQRKFGYRRVGENPKKHAFSLEDVGHWTVLELDLIQWVAPNEEP